MPFQYRRMVHLQRHYVLILVSSLDLYTLMRIKSLFSLSYISSPFSQVSVYIFILASKFLLKPASFAPSIPFSVINKSLCPSKVIALYFRPPSLVANFSHKIPTSTNSDSYPLIHLQYNFLINFLVTCPY